LFGICGARRRSRCPDRLLVGLDAADAISSFQRANLAVGDAGPGAEPVDGNGHPRQHDEPAAAGRVLFDPELVVAYGQQRDDLR